MNKMITIALLLSIITHSSCTNNHNNSDTTINTHKNTVQENDSIQKDAIAREIIKTALYEFDKDTIRQEWLSTHSYMWYISEVYIAETCGYDKNGLRVTTQVSGTHKKRNAFSVNRRTKVIIWICNDNGLDNRTEYQIKQIDEYPNHTTYGVMSAEGEELIFQIPDDGKEIYVLNNDATLTFFIKK